MRKTCFQNDVFYNRCKTLQFETPFFEPLVLMVQNYAQGSIMILQHSCRLLSSSASLMRVIGNR